jgi:signal transduction histidine kinase
MAEATSQGIRILGLSMAAALLLSILLSAALALSFTKPLNKMEKTALRLAGGDYTAQTGVRQGDEIGALAGAIDVLSGRLEAARQESRKLERLRQDFVANVSHELRTPVTVLRGSLEALCDGVITQPEQVADYHRSMLNETMALQRLVNDLLDLSRLQNADFRIEQNELNLCDVLRDAVRSAGRIAAEKGIVIRSETDTDSFLFTGDYGRLRQMLLILLDNAVKFSSPGSTVDVTLKDGVVSVRDRGAGIAEADLPYLFDRFYKVRSEENKNGSGLGLAIAKQIADRHGVRVDVDSTVGEGSEFRITFRPIRPI